MIIRIESTYSIGCVIILNSLPIDQESQRRYIFTLSLTEGVHQFLQRSRSLNLEVDLRGPIRDLQVDMGVGLDIWLDVLSGSGWLFRVGHIVLV